MDWNRLKEATRKTLRGTHTIEDALEVETVVNYLRFTLHFTYPEMRHVFIKTTDIENDEEFEQLMQALR